MYKDVQTQENIHCTSSQTHQLLDCRDCTVENSSTNPLNCTASGLTLTLRVIHTSHQVLRCQHSFSKHVQYRTKAQNRPPPKKKNNSTLHDSKVYYTSLFILNLPAAAPLLLHSISHYYLCATVFLSKAPA